MSCLLILIVTTLLGQAEGSVGSLFVHWGKTTCPRTTLMVYSGVAGGSHYTAKSGPANILCLPRDPIYDEYSQAKVDGATIYGTEYYDSRTTPDFSRIRFHDVPCAVCQLEKEAQVLMIPGRKECYPDWKKKYNGYLMAGHYNYGSSEYICVTKKPESVFGGAEKKYGQLLYFVESRCGSLPCPPYKENAELSCVVCAK